MTQFERMQAGLLYDPADPEIAAMQQPYLEKLHYFNKLRPSDTAAKEAYMREVFAECGENCYIELPFYANWGGYHLHLGSNIYANFHLTLVDDGDIFIADKVMIGPNVTIATAGHPVEPSLRARGLQFNKPVRIGENSWLGAGVTVLPGVKIGRNCVIGAGSVVTKDIPDNSVACGNPCRVLRTVSDKDRETFYKNEQIDWENL